LHIIITRNTPPHQHTLVTHIHAKTKAISIQLLRKRTR
jgi:hypothetical protein